MSLILRAHVAAAAQSVVPSWPLESFIAVNPLASHESEKFESAASSTVTVTREHSAYLSDFRAGRITELDLEKALLERTPALEGIVQVGDSSLPAVQVAIVDMTTAEW
jgi:DNA-binding NtrC family response regulator